MRRIAMIGLQLLGLAILSLLLGWKVWFGLWMYHSWPGSPGWWATFLGADGERAYDATMDEMSFICFLVLLTVWGAFKWFKRERV
jgi:hypothetical protein